MAKKVEHEAQVSRTRCWTPELKRAVAGYENNSGAVLYIAHWVWFEDKKCNSLPISREMSGNEKAAIRHPDQTFWAQPLAARPHASAVIVTDCRLMPCSGVDHDCTHAVPTLIFRAFGYGIPIYVFSHNERGDKIGRGYKTFSVPSHAEVDTLLTPYREFTWHWAAETNRDNNKKVLAPDADLPPVPVTASSSSSSSRGKGPGKGRK